MPGKRKAVLALIGANLIWGAASPIFKFALTNIPPFTLAFIRFYGASVILLFLAYPNLKIEKKERIKIIAAALLGVTFHISFYFLGLRLSPAINAPIISASGPIFIYILAVLVLHEKPHLKILTGIAISLIGVLLIMGQPLLGGNGERHLTGNLLIFLSVLGAVGHAIISKEIHPRYSAATITFWMSLIGALTFLPLFSYELITTDILGILDYRGIIGIIFGIFFSSALAYTFFEYGVR